MKKVFWLVGFAIATLSSCKKTETVFKEDPKDVGPVATSNRTELSLDSIFLYAKEIYFWNDKLPTYAAFNPRKYNTSGTDLEKYEAELLGIAMTPGVGEYTAGDTEPKYSYIFDKSNKNPTAVVNPVASVDLEGNGNDIGIRYAIFRYSNDPGYLFYVGAVYPNSPADKAGLTRGCLIKKINGTSFGANYSSEYNSLERALNSNNMIIEGTKVDGTSFNVSLTKSIFASSPIYNSKVIEAGTKIIGYLAYARFSNSENSENVLKDIFADFASKGVTDLMIDLRYNGGGYTSTAEYLTNLIAPSTATGVMFTYHYNATMQAGNAKILANQPYTDAAGKIVYGNNGVMRTYANLDYSISGNTVRFTKKGNLTNVKNVVFLVGSGTASSSELVINNLKPHMTVSLVGRTTYGKPIGFFPFTIENKYDVYLSLFETKNSRGDGGYYTGMTPTVPASELATNQNLMYDFGDVRDGLINEGIKILAPGSSLTNNAKTSNLNTNLFSKGKIVSSEQILEGVSEKEFKGMVGDRLKFKN